MTTRSEESLWRKQTANETAIDALDETATNDAAKSNAAAWVRGRARPTSPQPMLFSSWMDIEILLIHLLVRLIVKITDHDPSRNKQAKLILDVVRGIWWFRCRIANGEDQCDSIYSLTIAAKKRKKYGDNEGTTVLVAGETNSYPKLNAAYLESMLDQNLA